jgi:hypothetical protein
MSGLPVRVGAIQTALKTVREALLEPSPAALERCRESLAFADGQLRLLRSGPSRLERREAEELEREMSQLGPLLEQARDFYLGCSRILCSKLSSYRPDGRLTPLAGGGLSVRG